MKKMRLQPVGFTVIELLVAIVITSAMLLLINQIFVTSSRAVGRGIGLSDIIANGSAAANQFDLDTKLMIGPHEGDLIGTAGGGILIIVNKLIYAPLAKPFGPDTTDEYRTHADDQQVWRWVRSDQLVFIRRRVLAGDLRELPLAPASQNAFSPGDDGGLAKYIRIWYGHVQRTDIDGADQTPVHGLGQPGDNELATNWILGRHGLFLADHSSPGITFRTNGAWYNAPVTNTYAPSTMRYLYAGLTDYAYCSLEDPPGVSGQPADQHPYGAIVGSNPIALIGNNYTNRRLWATLTAAQYRDRAILNYTFAQERLRVNPTSMDKTYDAWRIGQMHPIMMEHVSDFAIEFAADINTGGTDTGVDPDDYVDTDNEKDGFVSRSGNIHWYGHWYNCPTAGRWNPEYPENSSDEILPFDSTQPVVYPVPSNWDPYENTPNRPHADGAFVWRHDQDSHFVDASNPHERGSNWPYLIRIRWRMHDSHGEVMRGEKGQHGIWFERIIAVSRPTQPS